MLVFSWYQCLILLMFLLRWLLIVQLLTLSWYYCASCRWCNSSGFFCNCCFVQLSVLTWSKVWGKDIPRRLYWIEKRLFQVIYLLLLPLEQHSDEHGRCARAVAWDQSKDLVCIRVAPKVSYFCDTRLWPCFWYIRPSYAKNLSRLDPSAFGLSLDVL